MTDEDEKVARLMETPRMRALLDEGTRGYLRELFQMPLRAELPPSGEALAELAELGGVAPEPEFRPERFVISSKFASELVDKGQGVTALGGDCRWKSSPHHRADPSGLRPLR